MPAFFHLPIICRSKPPQTGVSLLQPPIPLRLSLLPRPEAPHLHKVATSFVIAVPLGAVACIIIIDPEAIGILADAESCGFFFKQCLGKRRRNLRHHLLPTAMKWQQLYFRLLVAFPHNSPCNRTLVQIDIELFKHFSIHRVSLHNSLYPVP